MTPGAATNGHALRTRTSELLRFATAGSVDDGKSTLIGRLLHDSKSIFEDQLEHVVPTSERRGDGYVNLALLTDGLRAEREQGITIDVAYRYFQTPRRKFVIADTPGHEQYTRNMVTGASTADLSIVLVDARKGVSEQTRRHAYIASLLRIPHVVVCVNKMDLVEYDEAVFEQIVDDLTDWTARLDIPDVSFIPISALLGDNVVDRSTDDALVRRAAAALPPRARGDRARPQPRPGALPGPVGDPAEQRRAPRLPRLRRDGRRRACCIAGDEVVVLPSGQRTEIDCDRDVRRPGRHRVPDDVGDRAGRRTTSTSRAATCSSRPTIRPRRDRELDAMVCWMGETPLRPGARLVIKHTTRSTRARIEELDYRVEVNTLAHEPADELALNEIGRVRLRAGSPLMADPYAQQPRHRQLHPDRRGEQRHGGGGNGPRRALNPPTPAKSAHAWEETSAWR